MHAGIGVAAPVAARRRATVCFSGRTASPKRLCTCRPGTSFFRSQATTRRATWEPRSLTARWWRLSALRRSRADELMQYRSAETHRKPPRQGAGATDSTESAIVRLHAARAATAP